MKKLNRNQRIAVGILAFASVALLADKTVLSPRSAQAEVTPLATAESVRVNNVKTADSPESMASNLRMVSNWVDMNRTKKPEVDPFSWQIPKEERVVGDAAVSFHDIVRSWTLTSIMGTPGYRIAVINGKPVRMNEQVVFSDEDLRAARVVEIRQDAVVLYHDARTEILALPVTRLSGID